MANNISNQNRVSIENYSDTLAIIRELQKLGVFKSSKPRQRKTSTQANQQQQQSTAESFTTPIFTKINQDMTQSQIEDIQRKQAVEVATLREQVKQQRLEDTNFQQNQRFDDIQRLGNIFNNNFRTQTPEQPFNPLANLNDKVLDEDLPDINETTFSNSINEGAPKAENKLPTFIFEDDTTPSPRITPREPVGKKKIFTSKRAETIAKLGISAVPKQKGSTRAQLDEYYKALANTTDRPINENIQSKEGLFNEIYRIIDEEGDEV